MQAAVDRHLALLRTAVDARGGVLFKTVGDAIQAAFATAPDAVAAALDAQRAILRDAGPAAKPLRARMALHAGEATPADGDYLAPCLNRLARLLAAGHGGQILLSNVVVELARDRLPPGAGLRDLGEHPLRDLFRPERIAQLLHRDLPDVFPPLRTLEQHPTNLPAQPTPFIGRVAELERVEGLLRDEAPRLLTLTGPGGVGKTRLALQAAADVIDEFPDGVYLVELAPLTDAGLVPPAIAAALGVREDGSQPLQETIAAALEGKRLLLLFDNAEHLPDAAPIAGDLLARCPRLTILATSRAPLRLRAEREFPVPPLALPSGRATRDAAALSHYDAVRLFIERAVAARPEFAVSNETAPAVAEICARLDGLPLAIELAAARVRALSPPALLERLDRRLKVLTGGPRDAPTRQRTLRDAIAWSHDLLDPEQQTLFRRLAVFAGGFDLETAERVVDPDGDLDCFSGVTELVDDSLLRPLHGDGEPRFAMLETIREFGLERLEAAGEADAVQRAHAAVYADLAAAAAPHLAGASQGAWLGRLAAAHDNLRAALDWTLANDPAAALRLAADLGDFWLVAAHYTEGRGWLERALAAGVGAEADRARALTAAGSLARMHGDGPAATAWLEQALTLQEALGDERGAMQSLMLLGHVAVRRGDLTAAGRRFGAARDRAEAIGDRATLASALGNLGIVADEQGDFALAAERYAAALALFRELGDVRRIAAALDNLGILARVRGDYAEATRRHDEALGVRQALDDPWGVASTLNSLGVVAHAQGDFDQAEARYQEAIRLRRDLGDDWALATSLGNLAELRRHQGDLARAAALQREAMALATRIDDRLGLTLSLESVGAIAIAAGEAARGVRLLGAADASRTALGAPLAPSDRPDYDRTLAAGRAVLSEAEFAVAWEAGQALAWDMALAETNAITAALGAAQASKHAALDNVG